MRDQFRMWLQWFIGVLGVEKAEQARHAEMMLLLNRAIVIATDRHSEIIERLGRLENQMVEKHVNRRQPAPAMYDWEQVQAQELAEMLANPPKDEN